LIDKVVINYIISYLTFLNLNIIYSMPLLINHCDIKSCAKRVIKHIIVFMQAIEANVLHNSKLLQVFLIE